MQTTSNTLTARGIILQSGEISKDKINLVAGAITQPFAEMVWVTTGGDMDTINRLTDTLVTMNTPADRGKLFKIIKMLYGLTGSRNGLSGRIAGGHCVDSVLAGGAFMEQRLSLS